MAGALSSDDAEESSGAKPNFIGRVVESDAVHSDHGVSEEYREDGKEYFDHPYTIEVLDHDWKNLTTFGLEMSNNFSSKWMLLIGHLENIHGKLSDNGVESPEDLAEFLEGRVYEFRELTFSEDEEFVWEQSPDEHSVRIDRMFGDSENPPNEFIVPVREVSDEELEELGEESAEDVEEVEL